MLKFETRPNFLLNFGTANLSQNNSIDIPSNIGHKHLILIKFAILFCPKNELSETVAHDDPEESQEVIEQSLEYEDADSP